MASQSASRSSAVRVSPAAIRLSCDGRLSWRGAGDVSAGAKSGIMADAIPTPAVEAVSHGGPLLRIEQVVKRFGNVAAVDGLREVLDGLIRQATGFLRGLTGSA